MAAYGYGLDWPFLAGANFSDNACRWNCVGLSTSANKVIACTGASGSAGGFIGINQNNPSSGQEIAVRMFGMSKAVVDASNSDIVYRSLLSPVGASPRKLEPHPPTKAGSPVAIALGAVASGSARIEVFIFGPAVSA